MTKKIIVCSNTAWSIVNFRSGIIKSLLDNGFEVIAVAPRDSKVQKLEEIGCRFVHLEMYGTKKNPLNELKVLWNFLMLVKREQPDVYLGFTAKPNIYGSLACRFANCNVIANIAGLGRGFSKAGLTQSILSVLYKCSLKNSNWVFFQNPDDMAQFAAKGIVSGTKTRLLPGSGVDLERFRFSPRKTQEDGKCVFLMASRLVLEKGLAEYIQSATQVASNYKNAQFLLAGFTNEQVSGAVMKSELDRMLEGSPVEYLGASQDVTALLETVDCVVLPSYYREGIPRSLLEAAAKGRPVITTNAIGCREAVVDKKTGFLCNPKDPEDLATKLESFLALSPEQKKNMGLYARKYAEKRFDEKIVVNEYLGAIQNVSRFAQ